MKIEITIHGDDDDNTPGIDVEDLMWKVVDWAGFVTWGWPEGHPLAKFSKENQAARKRQLSSGRKAVERWDDPPERRPSQSDLNQLRRYLEELEREQQD